jgi:hypothetical protein
MHPLGHSLNRAAAILDNFSQSQSGGLPNDVTFLSISFKLKIHHKSWCSVPFAKWTNFAS